MADTDVQAKAGAAKTQAAQGQAAKGAPEPKVATAKSSAKGPKKSAT